MNTFEYRGYTVDGRKARGMVEALSLKSARETLAGKGILVETLSESGTNAGRVSADRRGILYRELAALVSSGIPLVSAIDTLMKTPEMKPVAGVLGMVRDRVREGAALADALAASRVDISGFERATIEVAERTGSLETVLVQLADFIDEHRRTKERVQQALFYPALVSILGTCVAIFMLGFLVPKTREMMSGTMVEMPLLTRIMLTVGDAVWPWGIVALGGLFLFGAAWVRRILAHRELRLKYNRMIFILPLIGRGYRLLSAIRFSRTLAILVRSGVALVDGVVLAGRSTGSVWIEDLAGKESESIRHGAALSDAVRGIEPISELLSGWAEVGEVGGSLPEMLERASERCQAAFERYLSRMLSLIEPVMLLLIGGFVLLIVLSVMLPMFSLSNAIAK